MINQNQIIFNNLLKIKEKNKVRMMIESEALIKEKKELEQSELIEIKWIWPWTVKELKEHWITCIAELLLVPKKELEKIITNPLSLKGIMNFINNSK